MSAGRLKSALWWTTAALVALTPLLMFPFGKDLFRLPKRTFLATGSTLLAAVVLAGLASGHIQFRRETFRKPPFAIMGAAVLWTLISTLVSTNSSLSLAALTMVCAYALFFIVCCSLIEERGTGVLVLVFVPAALNAILVTAQENGLQPFALQDIWYDRHLASTGLLGNPNYVGTYLAGSCLAAIALALASRGRARAVSASLAMLFLVGILSSQTLTAVLALLVGVAALALLASWRRGLISIALLSVAIVILSLTYPPMRSRVERLIDRLAARDYNALLTNRLTPFAAAVEITKQHPVAGSGPGTFGWSYFDAKVAVDRKYPALMSSARQMPWNYSFSEVHNDHLEIASETGLVGYGIFLAALVTLGSVSLQARGQKSRDPRRELARILSLPLALTFGLLTLAQFPLQLPSSALNYLFLAACCVMWGRGEIGAPLEFEDGAGHRRRAWMPLLLLLAVAAIWSIVTFGILPLRCDVAIRQLDQSTERAMSSPWYVAAPLARETLERCDSSLRRCRNKLQFLMVRGANLRILNRRDEAIDAYRQAAALEKRPEILFQLGMTFFESGRPAEAIEAFAAACSFQPSLLDQVPEPIRPQVQTTLNR